MSAMNIYQIVTQRIIDQLEKGVIPWKKPWFSVSGGAYNALIKAITNNIAHKNLFIKP